MQILIVLKRRWRQRLVCPFDMSYIVTFTTSQGDGGAGHTLLGLILLLRLSRASPGAGEALRVQSPLGEPILPMS